MPYKSLFIIDDDPIFLFSLNLYLKKLNFDELNVSMHSDTVEFLSTIKQIKDLSDNRLPALVISDLNMPDSNGLDLLDEVASHVNSVGLSSQFTFYALTSAIDPNSKKIVSQRPHIKDFISKPLSVELTKNLLCEV